FAHEPAVGCPVVLHDRIAESTQLIASRERAPEGAIGNGRLDLSPLLVEDHEGVVYPLNVVVGPYCAIRIRRHTRDRVSRIPDTQAFKISQALRGRRDGSRTLDNGIRDIDGVGPRMRVLLVFFRGS